MTGNDLKKIFKLSDLGADEFFPRVGLDARHKLYTQFSRQAKPIDPEVEDAVMADQELAQLHTSLAPQEVKTKQVQTSTGPSEKLFKEIVKMLNETITMLKDQLVFKDKAFDTLQENNKHIREDARVYRTIVEGGVKSGAVRFETPAKTAKQR